MGVISVENTSLLCPTLKDTREFTPERSPMDVISVDNTFLQGRTLKNTREFIVERNHEKVDNICLECPVLSATRLFTLCNGFEKALSQSIDIPPYKTVRSSLLNIV